MQDQAARPRELLDHVFTEAREGGALRYSPWRRDADAIPSLTYAFGDESVVEIKRPGSGRVMFQRRLYRLSWAGEVSGDVVVPADVVGEWVTRERLAALFKSRGAGEAPGFPLSFLIEQKALPADPQKEIAYHIAVNRERYGGKALFPVAALPAARIDSVLDARFALDEEAYGAVQYLKSLAESHRPHPMLAHFDTNVRDELLKISEVARGLYFYLLGDYLYDADKQYHSRDPDRGWWPKLACYLSWVGHTGVGLYEDHAGLPTSDGVRALERFEEELPDVLQQLRLWEGTELAPGANEKQPDAGDVRRATKMHPYSILEALRVALGADYKDPVPSDKLIERVSELNAFAHQVAVLLRISQPGGFKLGHSTERVLDELRTRIART